MERWKKGMSEDETAEHSANLAVDFDTSRHSLAECYVAARQHVDRHAQWLLNAQGALQKVSTERDNWKRNFYVATGGVLLGCASTVYRVFFQ